MDKEGVEPSIPSGHLILSQVCIPVPTFVHTEWYPSLDLNQDCIRFELIASAVGLEGHIVSIGWNLTSIFVLRVRYFCKSGGNMAIAFLMRLLALLSSRVITSLLSVKLLLFKTNGRR